MALLRIDRAGRHAHVEPPWIQVIRATARRHATEALVLLATVALVVVFAVAGYALTRYGAPH